MVTHIIKKNKRLNSVNPWSSALYTVVSTAYHGGAYLYNSGWGVSTSAPRHEALGPKASLVLDRDRPFFRCRRRSTETGDLGVHGGRPSGDRCSAKLLELSVVLAKGGEPKRFPGPPGKNGVFTCLHHQLGGGAS